MSYDVGVWAPNDDPEPHHDLYEALTGGEWSLVASSSAVARLRSRLLASVGAGLLDAIVEPTSGEVASGVPIDRYLLISVPLGMVGLVKLDQLRLQAEAEGLVWYDPQMPAVPSSASSSVARRNLIEVRVDEAEAARVLELSSRTLRQASRYAGKAILDTHYGFGDLVALDVLRHAHSPRAGEHLPQPVYREAFRIVADACSHGPPAPPGRLVITGENLVQLNTVSVLVREVPSDTDSYRPDFETDVLGFAAALAKRFG